MDRRGWLLGDREQVLSRVCGQKRLSRLEESFLISADGLRNSRKEAGVTSLSSDITAHPPLCGVLTQSPTVYMWARLSKHSALNPARHPGLCCCSPMWSSFILGRATGHGVGVSLFLVGLCVFFPESINERGGADRDGGSSSARPKLHGPEAALLGAGEASEEVNQWLWWCQCCGRARLRPPHILHGCRFVQCPPVYWMDFNETLKVITGSATESGCVEKSTMFFIHHSAQEVVHYIRGNRP